MTSDEHVILEFLRAYPDSAFSRKEISRKAVKRTIVPHEPEIFWCAVGCFPDSTAGSVGLAGQGNVNVCLTYRSITLRWSPVISALGNVCSRLVHLEMYAENTRSDGAGNPSDSVVHRPTSRCLRAFAALWLTWECIRDVLVPTPYHALSLPLHRSRSP